MKFNKEYLFYILGVIGVVGTLFVYLNVYSVYKENTAQLQKETNTLKTEIKDLEKKSKDIETYEVKMNDMNKEMAVLLQKFATYYQMEDMLLMICNMMNVKDPNAVDCLKEIGVKSTPPVLVYSVGSKSTLPDYGLYNHNYTFEFKTTYKGMKEIIYFVQNHKKLKTITEISFSYDKTDGLLQGSIIFDQHFLTGTGKLYYDPVLPQPEGTGVDNLFGETAADDYYDYFNNYYLPSLEEPVE